MSAAYRIANENGMLPWWLLSDPCENLSEVAVGEAMVWLLDEHHAKQIDWEAACAIRKERFTRSAEPALPTGKSCGFDSGDRSGGRR